MVTKIETWAYQGYPKSKTMSREVQLSFFDGTKSNEISVEDSAFAAGVSPATIKNWIKTGYLVPIGKRMIKLDSLDQFKKEIAGKDKLNKRANKSLKDSHDHNEVTSTFLEKIAKCTGNCDYIGTEYESRLSDAYRNKEGIFYTPDNIINELFKIDILNLDIATFCDPCCGSGNFVMKALSLGFKPENIYAFDTDPVAVELTKKRIFEKTCYKSNNIINEDFLLFEKNHRNRKFNYIFTNPPWGKKIERREREIIAKRLGAGSSIDTCSLFFFACLNALLDNGKLGLLLPEAFFNISSHEDARICALKYEIEKLIDFDKPFISLMTKAQAIILSKRKSTSEKFVICEYNKNSSERTILSFSKNPKSILNLHCSHDDANTIAYIFSINHITLKSRAKWGLGIVTGSNNKFIHKKPGNGLIPVFKGSDITKNGLLKPSCYIPYDMSLYQQVAPIEFYESDEKLIYRFISSRLCFIHDTLRRFVLNSANILIPNDDFPVSMRVLCELLNSDFMNWMFSKIFNTHKILRSDLEYLPIHYQFLKGERFIEDDFINNLGIERSNNGAFRIKK